MKIRIYNIFNTNNALQLILTLFVFVLIVDPADVLFRLKIPLFCILLVLCIVVYPRFSERFFSINILIYEILCITSFWGFVFAYDFDSEMIFFYYKTFLMTLLLPWTRYLRLLEKLTFPMIAVSFFILFIYTAMIAFPQLEIAIYALAMGAYEGTILMGHRTFIGIDFISVYYTSVPLFILPMSIYAYRFLYLKKNKLYSFLFWLLLFISVMMGATRTGMLAAILVTGIVILQRMWLLKIGKPLVIILGIIGVVSSFYVLNLLISDVTEASNVVKQGLLYYWGCLISDNPQILIFGQGVGAMFYTGELRGNTALSEWTYLELIRWFGIPLALIIMIIYIYPLFVLYKKHRVLSYGQPLSVAYIFYLLIAATNPYLLGSNGILALLVMYSYAFNPSYEKEYKG